MNGRFLEEQMAFGEESGSCLADAFKGVERFIKLKFHSLTSLKLNVKIESGTRILRILSVLTIRCFMTLRHILLEKKLVNPPKNHLFCY